MEKDFDHWNIVKQSIENGISSPTATPRDIWWVNFWINIGKELCGHRNTLDQYVRPAIILKRLAGMYYVLPLTTKWVYFDKDLQIPLVKIHHHKMDSLNSDEQSYAVMNQVRAISKKRLISKMQSKDVWDIKPSMEEFALLKEKIRLLM